MDTTYQDLANNIVALWKAKSEASRSHPNITRGNERIIIGLAGPPGSGKSTLAYKVAKIVQSFPAGPRVSIVSLDGFHLTRAELSALPNASEAFARRGAPWTFNAAAATRLVQQLKSTFGNQDLLVPTFDHAVKDPVPGGLVVDKDTEVCIVEGNYVLSNEGAWASIAELLDERWLLDVDPAVARSRVAARHLSSGIEPTMELALARTDYNDMPNGRLVMESSKNRYDRLIPSIEDAAQR
ncbi:hypothetical protein PFICI_05412 [Pestalotiopsis fici W106-1]|uniref:Phosphoribulokinase/uridine kinase domain-containing protein n=1 Tax=Pestalotiopsis fici (strain W106-1 / CGMCC3.15140) TaxID=1229662 RepID=W3XEA5_PESFW|nr:uncharacterized protein PFICI_05412 [Pestalotiopsis fici W106-1]ETS83536.1 hypothetical protein PFICI_05412 [Pestalotiopsis fici W106-1]